jgi:3D (Asp-Asp-Asp) domain-containing protein
MRSGFFVLLLLVAPLYAQRWMKFTASAYSIDGETASGKRTREGRTVAADPDVLPIGTRIQIRGAGPFSGEYVVHDSGPKIKGREVDIFIDDPVTAKKFGRKPVQVRILKKP